MDKLGLKVIIILFAFFLCSFGLNVYLLSKKKVPTDPIQTNDKHLKDSLAILSARIDSLKEINAAQYANLTYLRTVQLQRQRNYYEKEIARVKHLSADSSLNFFTAFTDREWRHYGSGSD